MKLADVTLGDIAGVIAALAFAYLVFRIGRVVGKAGEILEEARLGVKGLSDGAVPLLGEGISWVQVAGGVLVLAGIWFVNRPRAAQAGQPLS